MNYVACKQFELTGKLMNGDEILQYTLVHQFISGLIGHSIILFGVGEALAMLVKAINATPEFTLSDGSRARIRAEYIPNTQPAQYVFDVVFKSQRGGHMSFRFGPDSANQ